MKRLEAKYAPLHLVPLIERLGTPQVSATPFLSLGGLTGVRGRRRRIKPSVLFLFLCVWLLRKIRMPCIFLMFTLLFMLLLFLPANCHCAGGGPADQRAAVLRPLHVRGHPDPHPQLPAGRGVAWASTNQRRDARRRVHGVPPPVECHAVCLLHSRRDARVHSRVSNVWNLTLQCAARRAAVTESRYSKRIDLTCPKDFVLKR